MYHLKLMSSLKQYQDNASAIASQFDSINNEFASLIAGPMADVLSQATAAYSTEASGYQYIHSSIETCLQNFQ